MHSRDTTKNLYLFFPRKLLKMFPKMVPQNGCNVLQCVATSCNFIHPTFSKTRGPHAQDAAVDAFYRMHLEGRDTASAAEAVLQIYKEPETLMGCD
jgi:hypothetical protein